MWEPSSATFSVAPLLVETVFRGVATPELFLLNQGQPDLDPTRSYLFYAERPMGALAPDVIVAASDGSTVVHGSLTFENPGDQMRRTPQSST